MDLDNDKSNNEFAHPKKFENKKKRLRIELKVSRIQIETESTFNKKHPKKKCKSAYCAQEEARLEKLIFDDSSDLLQNLEDKKKIEDASVHKSKNEFNNSNENSDNDDNDSIIIMKSDNESVITINSQISIKTAAWQDEDDEVLLVKEALMEQNRRLPSGYTEKKYIELLQNKFTNIFGTPKWAKLDNDKEESSEDSDNELLKHSNLLISNKIKYLKKGNIDLKVLSHINKQTHTEGPFVNCVQFHKTSTVALVAGSSGVLSLFEIDGQENNKLHTMKFERFPIHSASFLQDGTSVLIGSLNHAHCHSYDLVAGKILRVPLPHGITNMKKFETSPDGKLLAICGRFGEVYLLSSITKELIGTIQMNNKCRCLAFTPDSRKIITHGDSSEIYTWDVGSRTCLNRALDDGCLSADSIAISPNGQFVATGSKQGVVNLYDVHSISNEKIPKPIKTILNLVTTITKLKFNPSSEILGIASHRKENAFKMLHLPSFTIFSNFPSYNTKMFNPLDIDFSPTSGYLSVSNNRGFAYLYRLKHYENY